MSPIETTRILMISLAPKLLAVNQQVAVQLLDVVLRQGDVLPGREHHLHDLGAARHLLLLLLLLLLVARAELLDLQIRRYDPTERQGKPFLNPITPILRTVVRRLCHVLHACGQPDPEVHAVLVD